MDSALSTAAGTISKAEDGERSFTNWVSTSLSRDEIITALESAPKLQRWHCSSVAKISDSLVVKYGSNVHLWEARNMVFASTIPGVRLPKVYDAWEVVEHEAPADDEEPLKTTYILMDYVQGQIIAKIWSTLDSERRLAVYRQISCMLEALHQKKLARPGPIGGGRSNGFCFTDYGAGPFETQKDMETWFNGRIQVCRDFKRIRQDAPTFTGQFEPLVMCHIDIHSNNVMLDAQDQVWLLDWDFAGAYPVYFEEASLQMRVDHDQPDFVNGLSIMVSDERYKEEIQRIDDIGFALTTGALCKPSMACD